MKAEATQLKALYEANGFLTAIDVLGKDELNQACKEHAKLENKFGKEYTQYNLHNIHMQYEWVMNLAAHPKLLDAITAVLGPNVILLDSRFICKYPSSDVPHKDNTAPYVAWHQDIKYWGFEGGPVASVWLAFDDVDAENGVLQVIPVLFYRKPQTRHFGTQSGRNPRKLTDFKPGDTPALGAGGRFG
ncbi:hypothetical protein XENTR_v10020848 [Xenopus tropicalis]|nr:hypothetical protein XENTR_v10020848 [Xenopus tropicalis]